MSAPRYPALCQINTRVGLTALSHVLGKGPTLDDVSGAESDLLGGAAALPPRAFPRMQEAHLAPSVRRSSR